MKQRKNVDIICCSSLRTACQRSAVPLDHNQPHSAIPVGAPSGIIDAIAVADIDAALTVSTARSHAGRTAKRPAEQVSDINVFHRHAATNSAC
jgi:hypothetical protein